MLYLCKISISWGKLFSFLNSCSTHYFLPQGLCRARAKTLKKRSLLIIKILDWHREAVAESTTVAKNNESMKIFSSVLDYVAFIYPFGQFCSRFLLCSVPGPPWRGLTEAWVKKMDASFRVGCSSTNRVSRWICLAGNQQLLLGLSANKNTMELDLLSDTFSC